MTFHHAVIAAPIIPIARVIFGVYDFEIHTRADGQACPLSPHFNHIGTTDKNGGVCGFLKHGLGRTQNALILAFCKSNTACRGGRCGKNRAHDKRRAEHRLIKFGAIGGDVINGPLRHTRTHSRLSHGTGHHTHQARVKRLGDQVVRAKGQLLALIGRRRFGTGGGARQGGDAFNTGNLHRVIDFACADIQGAAEDERKA